MGLLSTKLTNYIVANNKIIKVCKRMNEKNYCLLSNKNITSNKGTGRL